MSGETKKKCFVVSPIGDDSTPERAKQKKHANTVLKSFIKPALKGLIDEVVRADEISEPGDINRQVLERLANDDLVVADLSFHNPNVFYELAIRHMLGKPYVQIIHKDEKIPFDIGSKRTIKFDPGDIDSLEETRGQIRKQAEACLAPGFKVETPLGYAMDVHRLGHGDASGRVLSQLLEKVETIELRTRRDQHQDLVDALVEDPRMLKDSPLRQAIAASIGDGFTPTQLRTLRTLMPLDFPRKPKKLKKSKS